MNNKKNCRKILI